MRIPIFGNGDGKKKRDLVYSVNNAMKEEYGREIPPYSFSLENFVLRGGVVRITEFIDLNGTKTEVEKKIRVKRQRCSQIVGCLTVEDEHVISLNTRRYNATGLPYNAVDIQLLSRDYKDLAYKIGTEIKSRNYVPGFTVEKNLTKPNMSFEEFREIFKKL